MWHWYKQFCRVTPGLCCFLEERSVGAEDPGSFQGAGGLVFRSAADLGPVCCQPPVPVPSPYRLLSF